MQNILTIDLEEWYHANYKDDLFSNSDVHEIRIIDNTRRLLKLLDSEDAKATFFVLGYIAEEFPSLIKEIQDKGHEIATHGYSHKLVYTQTKEEFKADVKKSMDLIEKIIGQRVKGYRAPSWSITEKSIWAREILKDLEICYDSSVFPIKTFLYGLPGAPRFINFAVVNSRGDTLAEVPPSTVRFFKKNIPFSGGFYLRVLPYWFIKFCINVLNSEMQPTIIYLHPREIDLHQPRLKLNPRDYFIHYHGIGGCENKLRKLLKTFKFTSIENYYEF